MGDMTGSADEEGGDQKAVQLATAASSVLNAKAGKSSGNDSSAASERAAVSKNIYSNNKNKTSLFVLTTWLFFLQYVSKKDARKKYQLPGVTVSACRTGLVFRTASPYI